MKLILTILISAAGFQSFGQTLKNDTITKVSGEQLVGKVMSVGDDRIKFSYAGETLTYDIKTSDIQKVNFSGGRIQTFSSATAAKTSAETGNVEPAVSHAGLVAILPFRYLIEKRNASDEMTYKVQSDAYSFLDKHRRSLTLQAPNETNAILFKGGINMETIRGHTMAEICNLLGVEFIVLGTVTQNIDDQTTSSSQSGDYNNKNKSSTTTLNYKTNVLLNVFNDKGDSKYGDDHTSLWSGTNAYKSALEYLLKRTPVYSK